jgi:hypothetical protein
MIYPTFIKLVHFRVLFVSEYKFLTSSTRCVKIEKFPNLRIEVSM